MAKRRARKTRRKITIQVIDYPFEDWTLFTAEPLEVQPGGEVEEGEDYSDRRGFRTYEEAAAYAEELVKEYQKRGDEAWWDDATG